MAKHRPVHDTTKHRSTTLPCHFWLARSFCLLFRVFPEHWRRAIQLFPLRLRSQSHNISNILASYKPFSEPLYTANRPFRDRADSNTSNGQIHTHSCMYIYVHRMHMRIRLFDRCILSTQDKLSSFHTGTHILPSQGLFMRSSVPAVDSPLLLTINAFGLIMFIISPIILLRWYYLTCYFDQ